MNDDKMQNLAVEVIKQSVNDLVNPTGARVKAEAECFFYGAGAWKESREFWCSLVGLNGDYVARLMKEIQDGTVKPERSVEADLGDITLRDIFSLAWVRNPCNAATANWRR